MNPKILLLRLTTFVCIGYASAQEFTLQIGTLETHRELWREHEQRERKADDAEDSRLERAKKFENACAPYRTIINDAKDRIEKASKDLQSPVNFVKSEFEKTTAFEARVKIAQAERNAKLQTQIAESTAAINDADKRLQSIKFQELSEIPNVFQFETRTSPVNRFLLPAVMGAYDADTEQVAEFTLPREISFTESDGVVREFHLSGAVKGISMEAKQAEQARIASNGGTLFISLHAAAIPPRFSRMSRMAPFKEAPKPLLSNETKAGFMGIAAQFIAKLFGASDPGMYGDAVSDNAYDSLERSRNEAPAERLPEIPVLIIDSGWTNDPAPQALFVWNAEAKRREMIWQMK